MSNLSYNYDDTIAALATPAGIGAIAVIRLSGADSFTILNKIFYSKQGKAIDISKKMANTIHFGVIKDKDVIFDEVLVSIFIAPHSYTGENIIEVSCHGSIFIQQQILNLLVSKGARLANPGEFTLRAFLNNKLDLSQAEAVADLISSGSFAAHTIAIKQLKGGFSYEIKELRDKLMSFAALIELELDFSEEDVEFANRSDLKALVNDIIVIATKLINSFEAGNVIKNGIPVAIIGKPNAGKSTLLNVLLNEEKAIVSDIAGTTRDVIEDVININGISFRFIDTAGIREAKDKIEAIGIERTHQKISEAAVVFYIFDVNEIDETLLKEIVDGLESKTNSAKQKLILIGNKIDESRGEAVEFPRMNVIYISAKEKKNIEALTNALTEYVNSKNIDINTTIITNARHAEALNNTVMVLKKVLEGLDQNISGELVASDIRDALYYLGLISGEVTTIDLLQTIFSRFCIGK